jgi:predicted TIM-barrel fold metal-dependent hydrolase
MQPLPNSPRAALPGIDADRRRWLAAGAAAAIGAAVSNTFPRPASGADDWTKLPYIDAHSHVWSPDIERWPLAGQQTRADLKPLSFTPEELFRLAEPEGVGRVVLIQHSVYHLFDNTYLIDCARRFPGRFAIVGMIDDKGKRPGEKLRELLPRGVRGLRITPRVSGEDWLARAGMADLWSTAAETGQSMCCLIDPSHLPEVAAMCRKHEGTSVVIDHIARIGADGTIRDADVAALCDLARCPRVTVKLSAYYALGKKQPPYEDLLPLVRKVLDAFGPERCMWASDAPYQVQPPNTYAASIALIRDRASFLSAGDRQWLLTKTAERVFFG